MTRAITYNSENCYPDLLDLERVLRGMHTNNGKKKGYSSTELFQDFAVIFDWFHRVLPCLHNHGKHGFVSVIDVKDIVEEFVGRDLQEDALVAACHERGLAMKKMGRGDYFHDLEIKVPCLDRVMEVLPKWNEYVQERAVKIVGRV